jgi:hypothetical protein
MEKHNGRPVIRRALVSEAARPFSAVEVANIDAWLSGRGIDYRSHLARQSAAAGRKRGIKARSDYCSGCGNLKGCCDCHDPVNGDF